jgi:hypothetical protein
VKFSLVNFWESFGRVLAKFFHHFPRPPYARRLSI